MDEGQPPTPRGGPRGRRALVVAQPRSARRAQPEHRPVRFLRLGFRGGTSVAAGPRRGLDAAARSPETPKSNRGTAPTSAAIRLRPSPPFSYWSASSISTR